MELKKDFLLPGLLALLGLVLLGVLLLVQVWIADEHVLGLARSQGRAVFRQIVLTRAWNAAHGGVYAPVGPDNQPNPYLEVPDREVQIPGGPLLTRVNPAYMTRQISEIAQARGGMVFHITSLRPLRPQNAPDPWESAALASFEHGTPETFLLDENQEKGPFFRYMAPLLTEAPCLACHAKQGYSLGQVRGGISIIASAEPFLAARREQLRTISALYVILGLAGIGAVFFFSMLLVRQKRRAEEANRAKTSFLTTMSHEIRTPMTAIMGLTDLVLDTRLEQEQRDFLEDVRRASDHLLGVLNDILDLSKIEAGRMEIERTPFSLPGLCEDVVESLAGQARAKGLGLVLRLPPDPDDAVLVGDPTRVRQILVNLLGNAIKFTARGRVLVRADIQPSPAPDRSVRLHLQVADTGVGIDAARLTAIFEPFVQADGSYSRRFGGTGLGLTICRRLADLLGGRLWVESQPGQGSVFHCTLDFERPDRGLPPDIPGAASFPGTLALIVEQDPEERAALADMVRPWGLVPREAGDLVRAGEMVREAEGRGETFLAVLYGMGPGTQDAPPGLNHLAGALRPGGPGLVVLGYGSGRGEESRLFPAGAIFVPKPPRRLLLHEALMGLALVGQGQRPAHPGTGGRDRPDRALRVLLAEDNPVNQVLVVRILEGRGHEVTVAGDGRKALELLAVHSFDLVLMDVSMPELDGVEATRLIRADRSGRFDPAVPIIALTAHVMRQDREQFLAAGMDGHLTKPIHARELAATVEAMAEARGRGIRTEGPGDPGPVMGEPKVLDQVLALEHLEGDQELYREVLGCFSQDIPARKAGLEGARQSGSAAELVRQGHQLKGVALSLGAMALAQAALGLEEAASQGLAGAEGRLDAVLRELDRLEAAIGPEPGDQG